MQLYHLLVSVEAVHVSVGHGDGRKVAFTRLRLGKARVGFIHGSKRHHEVHFSRRVRICTNKCSEYGCRHNDPNELTEAVRVHAQYRGQGGIFIRSDAQSSARRGMNDVVRYNEDAQTTHELLGRCTRKEGSRCTANSRSSNKGRMNSRTNRL